MPPPEKRYKYYDLINELDVTGALISNDGLENDTDRSIVESTQRFGPKIKRPRPSTDEEFTDVEYLNDRTMHFSELDGDDPLFEELEELADHNPRIKTERSLMTTIHPNKSQASNPNNTQYSAIDDEYTLFGKLIAEKLRRMSKQRANRLEMKVMALLLIGDE